MTHNFQNEGGRFVDVTATALPVLVLFGLVGRNFVEGLTAGAVR